MRRFDYLTFNIIAIWLSCLMAFLGLQQANGATLTPKDKTDTVILEEPLRFSRSGKKIWLPAGSYRVAEGDKSNTLAVSQPGEPSILIDATVTSHNETIKTPIILVANVNSGEVKLILLLPRGRALDSTASYWGIVAPLNRASFAAPSQIKTLAKSRWTLLDLKLKQKYWPALGQAIVLNGPDLRVTAERLYFSNLLSTVRWSVTVTNHGNEDAFFEGSGSPVILGTGTPDYVGPGPRASTNTFIQPEQSMTFEVYQYYSCPRGGSIPTVKFVADLYNVINETDEHNNDWTHSESPMSVSGQPDLIVLSVQFEPATPTLYDAVKIFVEMQNIGTGPAILCNGEASWRVTQKPAGAYQHVGHSTSRKVDPGATFKTTNYGNPFAQAGTLSPGSYPITVVVDPGSLISESNETNNAKTVTLVVQ